jgi:hypothetical protein
MTKKNKIKEHYWRFFRAGGFDQVRIDSAQDLCNIDKLDQKLWAALACPVDNVHFDPETLRLIDSDGDKRIRANELVTAVKWTSGLLTKTDELVPGNDSVSVDMVSDTTDEGKKLRETIRCSLKTLGKDENGSISISELKNLEKSFSEKTFNGDGIITADTASDSSLKDLITEIIGTCGSVTDRSGKPGIDTGIIETFFTKAKEWYDWKMLSQNDPALQPLQEKNIYAVRILSELKEKVNDYFTRCAIAGYDERAVTHLNGEENVMSSCAAQTITIDCEQLRNLPVAQIKPHKPLPLIRDINPAWQKKVVEFNRLVVLPLFGEKETLSLEEWQHIITIFAPLSGHLETEPSSSMGSLGVARIGDILGGKAKQDLLALVEKDTSESFTFDSIALVDKFIRLKRDLHSLCKNFINFRDFYSKDAAAIFQAGTLFLDQRSCELCIKIDDANKHSLMAAMAGTYLVYCDCKRKGEASNLTIVAAFTNGDSDNLIVGRNGIFYDRNGKDWDATITKIIANPISLKEAFWLPYKNFVRMIESQVAKRAAEAETQSTNRLSQTAVSAVNVDKSKPDPVTPPKKLDIGVVAALGVAAGAIGTFVATLFGYMAGIVKLGPLAVIGALVGLVALISGPSLILAFIKLRKRNLGPILDAGGWAVNAKARISVPFGAILTQTALLPPGSKRDLRDPYAEKKSPWPPIVVTIVILYAAYAILNHQGLINKWTNGLIGTEKELVRSNGTQSVTDLNVEGAATTK